MFQRKTSKSPLCCSYNNMHLKISGYTLMLKELNVENNLHKQTKITLFTFPHSWSQHRPALSQMEGNMTHKPSLGTGGLIHSKQLMGRGNPSKTKNSQPLRMSSFLLSRKSLSFMYFIILLRSRKYQNCLSDGKIM